MKLALAMSEFSLIDDFFKSIAIKRKDVLIGIGDDAACLQIPKGMNLLISTDTLVSGVHFLPQWDAYDIAFKAVMVNVSDMAAMAAEPCWITLALTLPEYDEKWLSAFSQGLKEALAPYQIALIGGDTTKGPLSCTITIMGLAPSGNAITRQGAKPTDVIFVSGQLGAAALAVEWLDKEDTDKQPLMDKLLRPTPRVDLIPYLRAYATSAIDLSDGLSLDLSHICEQSKVGACINQQAIPISPLVSKHLKEDAIHLALSGGDDYELCFTVPKEHCDALVKEFNKNKIVCYPIGTIEKELGLRIKREDSTFVALEPRGYSHF